MRVRPSALASRCSAFNRGFSIPRFLKYAAVDCNTSRTVMTFFDAYVHLFTFELLRLGGREFAFRHSVGALPPDGRASLSAGMTRKNVTSQAMILSAARRRLWLAAFGSIGRDRRPLRGLNYTASSQRGGRSRGSVGNCTCEFFLRGRRCQSDRGAARCIFPLPRAAFAPASAPARSTSLSPC